MKKIFILLCTVLTLKAFAQHEKTILVYASNLESVQKALRKLHIDSFILNTKDSCGYFNVKKNYLDGKNNKISEYGILLKGKWFDAKNHIMRSLIVLTPTPNAPPPHFNFTDFSKMSGLHAYFLSDPYRGWMGEFRDHFNHPHLICVRL